MDVLNGKQPLSLTNPAVRVLVALRDHGVQTLSELANLTGLSRPTVRIALGELASLGLACENPDDTRGRIGRPASQYLFLPGAGVVVGVDIGAHRISARVGDLAGVEVTWAESSTSPNATAAARWTETARLVSGMLADAGIPIPRVIAATVGTVGIVDDEGRVTLSTAIPGWTGFDVGGAMRELLDCPVRVDSDACLAALGERWRGAAQGYDNLVFIHVGWRTGSAMLIGGEIYRGSSGASGEIGALPESGWSTARRQLVPVSLDEEEGRDAVAEVVRSARAGDAGAVGKIKLFAEHIAPGVAALVLTLDPQAVIIGGGLSGVGHLLIDPIAQRLQQVALTTPALVPSTLGADAVTVGAVRHALDYVEAEVLGITG